MFLFGWKVRRIYGSVLQACTATKWKGDRESYRKWNADFQRIARRDKRAFLNEQCKEIEENDRKGKTRDYYFSKRFL